ncbi:MAG: PBSX family phage terminase large subunit, partial [Bacteroidota bacterium]
MTTAIEDLLSPKQLRTFRQSNGRINLAHGSVRSGKSVGVEQYRWPAFVRNGPPGDLLMSGRTIKSLERNVLRPLLTLYGPKRFTYSLGKKEAHLFGRRIELEGANDARAEERIRGMTLAGKLDNEVTLFPEGYVREGINRMSVPGAQMFATTNPDSPYHYLKTDFIDREAELRASGLDVRVWHYTLD